jgi:acyl-CoA thioesterase FadM
VAGYRREHTVEWGDCDPYGIAYYPKIIAWFNETEHDLLRHIGHPAEAMKDFDRAFVMGEISFRFVNPVQAGIRVTTEMVLTRIGERTLHWVCRVDRNDTGARVAEGWATRVYVCRAGDGRLASAPLPEAVREALGPFHEER